MKIVDYAGIRPRPAQSILLAAAIVSFHVSYFFFWAQFPISCVCNNVYFLLSVLSHFRPASTQDSQVGYLVPSVNIFLDIPPKSFQAIRYDLLKKYQLSLSDSKHLFFITISQRFFSVITGSVRGIRSIPF